jgi:ATP-dependent DNA helicase RecG
VTADLEGEVSNGRLQLIRMEHPVELTKMLQGLASRGFLDQIGQKRQTSYRLPEWALLPVGDRLSPGFPASSLAPPASSLDTGTPETDPWLLEIARPAREKPRLAPELSKAIIRRLCSGRYLTTDQIAALMDRRKDKLQKNLLAPMVDAGELTLRYPEQTTHPEQAYRTEESE